MFLTEDRAMRLRSSGSPPSGASCLVMLVCLALFAFGGRAAASDPPKGENITWTFDKRLTDLEKRVAALEGGVKLFEANGPFELGATPLTIPLTPVKAAASDGKDCACGSSCPCGPTAAVAGKQVVEQTVSDGRGGTFTRRVVRDAGATTGWAATPPPVYANFRPPVNVTYTPVRFVGAGCANGTCR